MAKSEYITQGILRYQELSEQLDNLKKALLADGVTMAELEPKGFFVTDNTVKNGKPKHAQVKGEGIPRGDYDWETYTKVILRELGGKGKTPDAIDYALKANPRIPEKTLKDAIRGKMSLLARGGHIIIVSAGAKSEGYTYELQPDDDVYDYK